MIDLLSEATQVIREAGRLIMLHYQNESQEVRFKQKGDLVTQADLDSARWIEKNLAREDFGFLCEESRDDLSRLKKDYVWIVDPLDGTKDFITNTGDFTVMIGLVHRHRPVLGLVYQPSLDDLYFAALGKGAFLQHGTEAPLPLQVSTISDPTQARMLTSRYHRLEAEENLAQRLGISKLRPCGSAGLKTCLIARQEADLYLNTSDKTSEWDTCAADLILTEAGGQFMDGSGHPILYNQADPRHRKGFIATNGALTAQVLEAHAIL